MSCESISQDRFPYILPRCLDQLYHYLLNHSLLFIINIILGNVSIKYCSLTLDQVRKPSLFNYRLSVVQCLLGPQSLNTYCTTKSSPGTSMLP